MAKGVSLYSEVENAGCCSFFVGGKECVRRLAIAIGLIVLYLGRRSVEDFERWLEFFVQGVATNICRQFLSSFFGSRNVM